MIIQKLRLQNGWSQQQLADMSGLSCRTIQRIENGQKPSVESIKSLAAVFEVDFLTLQGALTMNTNTAQEPKPQSINLQITDPEKKAFKHVRRLQRFYKDLFIFFIMVVFLTAINWFTSPSYWWVIWVVLGWGLSFVIRAVELFFHFPIFDADWEKRQVAKHLNRKP
ncbi:MAG: helix-turn-helix domain-containing protein [Gammaproteobacteria bacterium]|nr:helix-turn-helix domain-containing protein [Gammaproteobacteria bacterium]